MSDNDSERRAEFRQRDPLSAMTGGLVLILLGVAFLLAQNQMFGVRWDNFWGVFLIGMGGILLLQAFLRALGFGYRRHIIGQVIGAGVLITIGLIPFGGAEWSRWWPLGLIALGVVLLLGQFTRRW
ncbi:MAG: hypothetical protein L0Y55_19845 [Anaerolineales bacterium]|nr:hypothetical protein [Anaerolineales bacterium]